MAAKPENKGNFNFNSNWNLPIVLETWCLKTFITICFPSLDFLHYVQMYNYLQANTVYIN